MRRLLIQAACGELEIRIDLCGLIVETKRKIRIKERIGFRVEDRGDHGRLENGGENPKSMQ